MYKPKVWVKTQQKLHYFQTYIFITKHNTFVVLKIQKNDTYATKIHCNFNN